MPSKSKSSTTLIELVLRSRAKKSVGPTAAIDRAWPMVMGKVPAQKPGAK
jgi:hypothetical protein